MEAMSPADARRTALAAQGFDRPRPTGPIGPRQLRTVLRQIGILQLDSTNVLCRSHYLPLFSRLGPYPRSTLDRMAWGRPRELFEFWGHQASLLPLELYPALAWRMAAARDWDWRSWTHPDRPGQVPPDWSRRWDRRITAPWAVIAGMTRLADQRPGLLAAVTEEVRGNGPLAADDVAPATPRRRRGDPDPDPSTGRMWNWQDGKIAIEWLFCTGAVTTATRRGFTRLYDLTERVLPAAVDGPALPEADAVRELVRRSAAALGVADAKQLRDYFLLPRDLAQQAIAELTDAGELIGTRVDGIRGVQYRWHRASAPPATARALLSPFDSLIWSRDRIERLFGFRYRISIYTRAAERRHGYYVLPFLLGDRFVARVDLAADRQRSILSVPTVTAEPDVDRGPVAEQLAAELRSLAGWLELDRIVVGGRGDLSPALRAALRR